MALTLITGAANAGKTGRLYEMLRNAGKTAQPILLVPQGPDVRRATREFAAKGILGVRVVCFDDWTEELWRLYGDGRGFVTHAQREALLARVVEGSSLQAMEKIASTPGFLRTLAQAIRRIAVLRLPNDADPIEVEAHDIFVRYGDALAERGLIEPAQAAAALAESPPPITGPIGVNWFAGLSSTQESLLIATSRVTDVHIALAWRPASVATEALTPLVSRLEASGGLRVEAEGTGWTDPGLQALANALFEETDAQEPPGSLALGLASDTEAESALIARRVRDAIDRGVRPGDIAVVFRDAASRAESIVFALAAQGVSAFADVAEAFTRTPFGAALSALMDACIGRGDVRERLLQFLLSPYSGAQAEQVAFVDRSWREAAADPSGLVSSARRSLGGSAEKLLELAERLAAAPVDEVSATKWEKLAGTLLVNAHRARNPDGLSRARDAVAHKAMLRAVSELAAVGVGADELMRALRDTYTSVTRPETPEHVLVTEAHRLRGRRFHTLVIGGLTAQEYPLQLDEPVALKLARRLGAVGLNDTSRAEKMLSYTLVTRARSELFLVRRERDDRGEPMQPSVFWEEVLDVYRGSHRDAEAEIPDGIAVVRLSEETSGAGVATPPESSRSRRFARIARPPRGRLVQPEVLERLAAREEFSVSELETYLGCPYRWFCERAVSPENIDAEWGARERGSRAHELLRMFYERWHAMGRSRILPDELDDALGAFDALVREEEERARKSRASRGVNEELLAAKAAAWARGIIIDDVDFMPGFAPVRHELRFGERSGLPVRLGDVGLAGSIDRVDAGQRGIVVVDYKSSSVVQGRRSFATQGLIQLPVYAAVAQQLLGQPSVGAVYRSLRSLSVRGFWRRDDVEPPGRGSGQDGVDADGFANELERAVESAEAAAMGIRAGRIEPAPRGGTQCRFCEAQHVCERGR